MIESNTFKLDFCVATLALGVEYSKLATMLARDLSEHQPGLPLIVLTDKPNMFSGFDNVLVKKHKQKSLWAPFHDKLYVVSTALKQFESCLFIDADTRITCPLPLIEFSDRENRGVILADSAIPSMQRARIEIDAYHRAECKYFINNPIREWRIVSNAHKQFNLHVADTNFIREHLFYITRYDGKEVKFINTWRRLSLFFELRGFSFAEGHAIGMAAVLAGIDIREFRCSGDWCFKDVSRPRLSHSIAAQMYRDNLLRERTRIALQYRSNRNSSIKKLLRLPGGIIRLLRYPFHRP